MVFLVYRGYALTTSTSTPSSWTSTSGTSQSLNWGVKDAGTYYVWAKDKAGNTGYKAVTVSKANGSGSVSMTGWTYGNTANDPSYSSSTNGTSNVTINYKVSGAADSTYSGTKPSTAGNYVIRAVFATTTNYNSVTATNTFTIAKATPTVTLSPTSASVYYNSTNEFLAQANVTGTLKATSADSTYVSITQGGSDTSVSANTNTTIKYAGVQERTSSLNITVSFTPTDTTNYNNASATFVVNAVDPATYTIEYYQGTSKFATTSTHTVNVAKDLTTYSALGGSAPSTWTFEGWSANNGTTQTSKKYTDGQSVTNLATTNGSTIKLYAVFNHKNKAC